MLARFIVYSVEKNKKDPWCRDGFILLAI